jgi:hypothetical protein
MTTSFSVTGLFDAKFTAITDVLVFDPRWNNGTGYFDHGVEGEFAPVIPSGIVCKTEASNGRKMIFVGTPLGNIVVFQRYDGRGPIVSNQAFNLRSAAIIENGSLSIDELRKVLGDEHGFQENIGNYLDHIKNLFTPQIIDKFTAEVIARKE